MSTSLQPHGLYSPWNFPGQNTGVGSLSLLQGSSQPRDQTQVSHIAGGFFTSWATSKALRNRLFSYISHPCVSICVVAPQPGMEPMPPAVGGWSLNHRIPREVPISFCIFVVSCFICLRLFLTGCWRVTLCKPSPRSFGKENLSIPRIPRPPCTRTEVNF